jgi:hypothetical protein
MPNQRRAKPRRPIRIAAETFNTFLDLAGDSRAHRHDLLRTRRPGGSHLWVFAVLTEDLIAQGSAEAQICEPGSPSAHPPVLSENTITVWDYGLTANVLLVAGTLVQAAKANLYDRYYVLNAYST